MAAPTLTGFRPSVTFYENAVNAAPRLLDAEVVFADPDGDFDGGSLTLSGLLAEDRASVRNQGAGAGQIGFDESTGEVTYAGVQIGTATGGAGADLVIAFNAAATSAAVDALIQNLTYANVSDTPTASRLLQLAVIDGAALAAIVTPSFSELTGAANPFDGVDVGSSSRPAFADLDGDGDLDPVVGDHFGILHYFENTGSASAPAFIERTGAANPFDGVDLGDRSAPSFTDLDGDGDVDAIVGELSGALNYFENTGSTVAPAFTERTGAANPFDGVDVGDLSAPSLADLDGDGDLDAVVGENHGILNYFENTGTAIAPAFVERTGAANPFDGVDVGTVSAPSFADLDGDGDVDVIVGKASDSLRYFENTGTAAAPAFVMRTGAANPFDGVDMGFSSAPSFADLDGDGELDLTVGAFDGALRYWRNGGQGFIAVNVTAQLDSPTLSGLAASVTFAENAVNAAPQLLDAQVVFADAAPDADLDGGSLTLSGLLAEDLASVRDQGSGAGQIGFNGGNGKVRYGGVLIGTATGGAGADLVIDFNAAATSAAVDALIQNLTYANVSDTPTASRLLQLVVIDGAALAAVVTPSFSAREGAANPFDGVDVGDFSAPSFADLDGDGDQDAVVGDDGGVLSYFENTGTAAAAAFTERTGAANPFDGVDVGGYSKPAFADLDGDGDLDMLIGDDDSVLSYFENTGSAAAPVFTERTGAANPFDGVYAGAAPSLNDLDGDGDLDAVIGENGADTLNYFENTGSVAAPVFTERTGTANPFDGVEVSSSVPSFADLDGDGDLDAVVGETDGALIYFENTGSAAAPAFVERIGAANPFAGVDLEYWSAPSFADLDGDGDLDLTAGAANGALRYWRNDGANGFIAVNVTAQSEQPTVTGFRPSVSFDENAVNAAPQLLDAEVVFVDPDPTDGFDAGSLTLSGLLAEDRASVRNQGAGAGEIGFNGGTGHITYGGVQIGTATGGAGADLVIAFNAAATSAAVDALIQNLTYANISDTPTAGRSLELAVIDAAGLAVVVTPSFSELTGAANPFDGVDAGSLSRPALADLNGDGDLDVLVAEHTGGLIYFENTGSALAPLLVQQSGAANPFDGVDVGEHGAPSFADLDGDGDVDAIVGELSGALTYFENTGSAAAPAFVERTGPADPFDGVDVGAWSAPTFTDLDGDDDLDAVIGGDFGPLNYFKNTGTTLAPVFAEQAGTDSPFDGVNVGDYSAPGFADLDGDGDQDMVVGELSGALTYFENTGSAAAPAFVERTGAANPFDGVDVGIWSAPSFADLDGDGDLDLTVGALDGALRYWRNDGANGFIDVTVTPQNDAPSVTAPAAYAADVGAPETLTGLSFADPDAGSTPITVTVESDFGTLSAAAHAGVTVGGDGTDTLTLAGMLADLNAMAAAGKLAFTSDNLASDATLTVTVDDGGATGGGALSGVANISITVADHRAGGAGDDVLTGVAKPSLLEGLGGDDSLSGAGGNDTLQGGTASDLLHGGVGNDLLDGGGGFDTASYAGATAAVKVNLSLAGEQNTLGAGRDTLISIEGLLGSGFADTLTGDGSANTLTGGTGKDTLTGGLGDDRLNGGEAKDTASYVGIVGAVSVDLLLNGPQNTGAGGMDTMQQMDNLIGGSGSDTLGGNNKSNRLDGGAGDDVLEGRLGADELFGGAGNDTLIGGGASDTLTGGPGRDDFIFLAPGDSTKQNPDLIADLTDFDTIDLSAIDANAGVAGDQAFVLVTGFTNTAGEAWLRYEAVDDRTSLLLDVDGNGKADMVVLITGDHSDFTGMGL